MQATALRNSQGSFERTQVVIQSYSILDAMRANRQVAEETMINQRDQARLPGLANLREFQGHPVYSASNPPAFISNE